MLSILGAGAIYICRKDTLQGTGLDPELGRRFEVSIVMGVTPKKMGWLILWKIL